MGIFNKVKERERKLCLGTPGKHLGNTWESPGTMPGKHPGNTRHKRSRFRKKQTSLAILVGILNKEKEKNNAPGKHPDQNARHLRSAGNAYKIYFLMPSNFDEKNVL